MEGERAEEAVQQEEQVLQDEGLGGEGRGRGASSTDALQ